MTLKNAVIAAFCLAACSTTEKADRSDVLLLKGKISKIEFQDSVQTSAAHAEDFAIGGNNVVSLFVQDALIGNVPNRKVTVVLRMASMPVLGGPLDEVLLLARRQPSGDIDVVTWNYAVNGLCVDSEMARAFGITDEVERLTANGILRC